MCSWRRWHPGRRLGGRCGRRGLRTVVRCRRDENQADDPRLSLVFLSATELASLAERDSAGTPVVSLVTLALRLGTLDTPDAEA